MEKVLLLDGTLIQRSIPATSRNFRAMTNVCIDTLEGVASFPVL